LAGCDEEADYEEHRRHVSPLVHPLMVLSSSHAVLTAPPSLGRARGFTEIVAVEASGLQPLRRKPRPRMLKRINASSKPVWNPVHWGCGNQASAGWMPCWRERPAVKAWPTG
jgi:hypothetical protein